jgi:predicted ribosome quality control (RQC) complex YloA/Tae2 family protein
MRSTFMTPVLIQVLVRELRELLLSARLSHISQSAPDTVELSFYHPDRPMGHLTLALLPQKPLLFASMEKRPALPKPPNLCRSLRKHLEYAQLTAIEAEPGERLVHFHFKTAQGPFRLVFEGIPKYPNLILVGPDGLIISALTYKNEVERPVLPQVAYHAPPHGPSGKEGGAVEKPNLWGMEEDGLRSLWGKAGRPPLAAWLKNDFRGCDPELAAYLESFGDQAFAEWAHTRREIAGHPWGHFVLSAGLPPSLQLFPHHPPSPGTRSFGTASGALEALFRQEAHYRELQAVRTRLESEIVRAIKHERRILEKLKKDRAEAESADRYQWWGELLMSQLHKVKAHQKEAILEDLVRGGPQPVTIPLDPEASPLVNAQRYFKKAQKGTRGLSLVEAREREIQARLEQLKSAQRSLPALNGAPEMRKAFQELFPKKPAVAAKPRKPKEEKVPTPNILRTKLGRQFELCVGTSAAANEYVTFQLAQPEDLWFHARDLPGAHVVLRRLKREVPVPEDLLLAAAREAAAHSKAQPGSKVTVSYTEKKNVKKIPGAPMGMVTMTKEKSITIQI